MNENLVTFANYQGSFWKATSSLRFVTRDGARILQQAFVQHGTHSIEWRDVPLVEESQS